MADMDSTNNIIAQARQLRADLDSKNAMEEKKFIAKNMSEALLKKDYQTAVSLYSQIEPEGFKTIMPQLQQIDPNLAKSLGEADFSGKYKGMLDAQTEKDSNPNQLQQLQNKGALDVASLNASTALAKNSQETTRKDDQFKQRQVRDYQKEYNTSINKMDEKLAQVKNIDSFASEATKNPLAYAQLGVQVAKAMGEVGALSETDVKRYIENKAVANQVAQNLTKMSKGTLDPKNAKYLKETMGALGKMYQDRKGILQGRFVTQIKNNLNLSENEAKYRLGMSENMNDEDAADAMESFKKSTLPGGETALKGALPKTAPGQDKTTAPAPAASPELEADSLKAFTLMKKMSPAARKELYQALDPAVQQLIERSWRGSGKNNE